MKLLYTPIGQDMTQRLAQEAQSYAQEGKRVFYIAPNSLSFEKERQVLQCLPQKASFAITITRFTQLARYVMLKDKQTSTDLDDLGLAMVFYRVMTNLSTDDLQLYGQYRHNAPFIKQLVSLYKELRQSQLALSDLAVLDAKKYADLTTLLTAAEAFLTSHAFEVQTPLSRFSSAIQSGALDNQLRDMVVVVDGFTRFSAEEERLLTLLNERCHEVVIGTYASQKAYQATYRQGSSYEASVDFLRHLAQTFQTNPIYCEGEKEQDLFQLVTERVEAAFAFHQDWSPLPKQDYPIQIWESPHLHSEIEAVARDIRAKLFEGYRYKDIVVLVGDMDSYRLSLGQVFKRYEIPYYLSKAESMAHHPLVHFVEALERLKRYGFKAEDLVYLLKTGLYGQLSDADIDVFDQYVRFAVIDGLSAFQKPFTINRQTSPFDLDRLNTLRQMIIAPLELLFKARKQSVNSLLSKWLRFLEDVEVTKRLEDLVNDGSRLEVERHEEVWRAFLHLMETMQVIFADEALSLSAFFVLLTTSMQATDYRLVPATLDVVSVNSYDMVQPHTAKLVYAIGLTQNNLPRLGLNTSLLTDEERATINASKDSSPLMIASQETQKRYHFIVMSLLNAASDQLVLSSPRLYQDTEASPSSYLTLLQTLGIPLTVKGHAETGIEDLGSYYGLLSRLIDFYQGDLRSEDFSKDEQTFWSATIRVLRQKLAKEGLTLPALSDNLVATPLSPESLAIRYPKDKIVSLSASALTTFYNNEYGYFLRYVLGLKEEESIRPNAFTNGQFLHRVFELVLSDKTDEPFDHKLQSALVKTKSDRAYANTYQRDAQSRYTQGVLEDIARATGHLLQGQSPHLHVIGNEISFGQADGHYAFSLPNGYKVAIKGKIDRLDCLTLPDGRTSYGVVDYKSSAHAFSLSQAYNKLSPQLLTYLAALTDKGSLGLDKANDTMTVDRVFGAVYLHMQEPHVSLDDVWSVEEVFEQAQKDLRYKGLFVEESLSHLGSAYATQFAPKFSREELETLMAYTLNTYKAAATRLLSGQLAINPYSKDGQTVDGEQFKAITGFEANRHMAQARLLRSFPRAKQKDLILEAMKGELS